MVRTCCRHIVCCRATVVDNVRHAASRQLPPEQQIQVNINGQTTTSVVVKTGWFETKTKTKTKTGHLETKTKTKTKTRLNWPRVVSRPRPRSRGLLYTAPNRPNQ